MAPRGAAPAPPPNESLVPGPAPPTHAPNKRTRSLASASTSARGPSEKCPPLAHTNDNSHAHHDDTSRLAHWVENQTWPAIDTDSESPRLPSTSGSRSCSRTTSTFSYSWLRQLEQNRIHLRAQPMSPPPEALCQALFVEHFTEPPHALFPPHRLIDAINKASLRSRRRILRDITPWVVPSPELLSLHGVDGLDHLAEGLDEKWFHCSTMGLPCPKPSMTVGLKWSAFQRDERQCLDRYTTPDRPCCFTASVDFPFLFCEARMMLAPAETDVKNLHSAAIAIRAVFQLYTSAWGWKSAQMLQNLNRQVMVFSIAHDAHCVEIYGYFAVCDDANGVAQLDYYRVYLHGLSLTTASERLTPCNFVRNIYDQFAPQHLARLRSAARQLVATQSLNQGSSEADNDIGMLEAPLDRASDDALTEGSRGRKQVGRQLNTAAMATVRTQLAQLMEQLTQTTQERQANAQVQDRLERQLVQQKEDSERQLAQQREDSERQLARMDRIVELLQRSNKSD